MKFTRDDTKVIKGIAIVLMIYHHLFFFPDRIADSIQYIPVLTYNDTSVAYLIGQFGKLCVALFLFLGGYGTFLSLKKYEEDDKVFAQKTFNKIKNTYIEYWKVFVIFVPICLLMGVERVVPDIQTFIWNFSGLSISYCGEWWFFTTYVALVFTYPVGRRLLCKQKTVFQDMFIVLLLNWLGSYILPGIYSYSWAERLSYSLFWNIFSKMLTWAPVFYMGCVFAKYDLLAIAKQRFLPKIRNVVFASAVLVAVFCLRKENGTTYDFLFAPIVTIACTVILGCPIFKVVRYGLGKIGSESTIIWLVHSVYCYLLCQKFVFMPRYTFLIFLWLLFLSFVTSVGINKLFSLIMVVARKIKFPKKESAN